MIGFESGFYAGLLDGSFDVPVGVFVLSCPIVRGHSMASFAVFFSHHVSGDGVDVFGGDAGLRWFEKGQNGKA